jgi:poly(A) polymerase
MGEPKIVPRAEHVLSRKLVDPEALKVLYRLNQANYTAYLVGGSVRDLLLGRKPKDFDIGTSAHPYEVKKLFRNCWIIGRRFRLAHVRFGDKTIEVATFRRQVSPDEPVPADSPGSPLQTLAPPESDVAAPELDDARDRLIHRDNTFGTPEQDAFRRDFTINALFYDIATFSIIDYTGGLDDLRAGIVRCIGVPEERFQEDPVRMLRAVAMAARLGFTIDPPIEAAIAAHRGDIARSAPARLIEEFYKLLRSGAAERAFRMLAEHKLLEPVSEELQTHAGDALWRSLAALDAYRNRFESAPDTLTNSILLGSLLMPIAPAAKAVTHPPRWTDDM